MKQRKYLYHVDDFMEIPEDGGLEDVLGRAFDPLEGSGADTLVFCFETNNANLFPSRVAGRDGDVHGFHFAQYSTALAARHYDRFREQGINLMQEVIDEGHRRGYDIFCDFRISDQHDHWDHCSDTLPMVKVQNPHWLNPKEYFPDYAGNCEMTTAFDFTRHEVREFKLTMLREILDHADFDGVELDFMRTQTYFRWDKGPTYSHYLTDFVKKARALLDEAGERRGKRLELCVRVCTTPEGCRAAGLDVQGWARGGLVDFVIAGTGGLYIDTKGYRERLSGTGVGFYPCHYSDYERIRSDDATVRGVAETLYMDEPDGLYLFNFYPVQNRRTHVVAQLARPERLRGMDKTYIVDVNYDYNPLTNEEWRFAVNLPAVLDESEEWLRLPIRVGENLMDYDSVRVELMLFILNHSLRDVLELRFNDAPLNTKPRVEPGAPGHMQHYLYYSIDKEWVRRENTLSLRLRRQNEKLARYARLSLERVNLLVRF